MRFKKYVYFMLVIPLFYIVVACGKSTPDYYPIKENESRKYKVSTEFRNRKNINSNTIDSRKSDSEYERVFLAQQKLKDKDVIPIKMVYSNNRYSTVYMIKEKDGCAFFAYAEVGDQNIIYYDHPNYVLKIPVEVGRKWERNEKMSNITERYPVKLVCNVESISDTVIVPKGTFEKCVKVHCEGTYDLTYPLIGIIKFTKTMDYWLAPGEGYVKGIYRDSCSLDTIMTTNRIEELVSVN